MDIKELDCDRMCVHPNAPNLVKFLEKEIPTIKSINIEYEPKVFNKTMLYKYVLLLYDPESELNKMHNLDWFAKKYNAALYAGFELKANNKFDKKVEDMVFGRISGVCDLIAEFVSWQNNQQWQHLVFLKEVMNSMTRDSISGNMTKYSSTSDYMKVRKEYMDVSQNMVHIFDETEDFVSRFYYNLEEARRAVKSEDYATRLAEGDTLKEDNPYGVNFVVDNPKFLGDDEEYIRERLS